MKTVLKMVTAVKSSVVKNSFTKYVLIIFAILFSVSSYGTTYYVAPNGSNSNAGTENQPWRTIQKAADNMIAGDIVYMKAGIYNERIIPKNSGSVNNYIVYSAFPGDVVTIDGSGISLPSDWGGLFHLEEINYIHITGLRIFNAGNADNSAGILVDICNNIIIEKNYTYNTTSSGIGIWNCENVIIDGNEVELACNDGEQECISVGSTNNFEIKNNHVHHGGPGSIGGEGIDAKDGSSNGKIYNNHVHNFPDRLGIYIEAWDKHTYNLEIYNNLVHNCGADGMTLASEMGGLLENISVYNNIIYNNKYVGLSVTPNGPVANPPMKNIKIINNTIYNNGWDLGDESWGGGIGVDNPNLSDLIIRNNIISQNLFFQIAIEYYGQNFSIDHNLIDGFRDELSEETRGNDYVEGEANFVNVSGFDFHLQVNSLAIDTGSSNDAPVEDYDGNPRPFGPDFDIGAFEYGQTSVDPKPTDEVISGFNLFQNYPNPFNPQTTIMYKLPRSSLVEIAIYNLQGKLITHLIFQNQKAGFYQTRWNSRDFKNLPVKSGVYIYRIKAGDFVSAKKMTLLR
jgi:hypothetical protein